MKRILLLTVAFVLTPMVSYAAEVPTKTANEVADTNKSSEMSSSYVSQVTALQSVYANESSIKTNTVYLGDSTASGIYAEQNAHVTNAAIVSSNVNVNSIQVYSGAVSSSTVTQSTYVNGADVQYSTLEINRVILN